jgi:hypothetical protein
MARKTTGNGSTNRSKKTGASNAPVAVEVTPEVRRDAKPSNAPVAVEVAPEVRRGAKPSKLVPVNLEEEIRHRAYELYLQRRGTAGDESGDQNQDWLIAEREVRLRYGSRERRPA